MKDLIQDIGVFHTLDGGSSATEGRDGPIGESLRRGEDLWSSIYDLKLAIAEMPADRDRGRHAKAQRGLREVVRRRLPRWGRVAVLSNGDPEWLDLYGRRAEPFPQDATGRHFRPPHPIDVALIANLESLRAREVEYLLIPEPEAGWLASCPGFARHLQTFYPVLASEEGIGAVLDLRQRRRPSELPWWQQIEELLDEGHTAEGDAASVLDWGTGLGLRSRFPECAVVWAESDSRSLPYADGTIDVVVLSASAIDRMAEARRVASRAVVVVEPAQDGWDEVIAGEGGRAVSVNRLRESRAKLPSSSIVIPTYNGISHLAPCLRALSETLPVGFDGQVIVVDDASTDDTPEVLGEMKRTWDWLNVVRNRRNLGFVSACNLGAREAATDFLVFLNNDTVPLPGWLPPLLGTFGDWPDAGAVGGKLLYPDGRLQEAGCVLFADGSGANFGRNVDRIDAPLFNYVRRVSYCSGALLATRRDLFLGAGGFDQRFRPAYYEDADYCMSLSEGGYSVLYQPESVVVHIEGATGGTDLRNGIKRYQRINQDKFVDKWSHALSGRPAPPGWYDTRVWHELANVY